MRFAPLWLLGFLLFAPGSLVRGENLVPMRVGSVPAPSELGSAGLLCSADTPMILADRRVWRLQNEPPVWREEAVSWLDGLAVIARGQERWLLTGAAGLAVATGARESTTGKLLPSFSEPLAHPHVAWLERSLLAVGNTASGRPVVFAIDPDGATPVWRAMAIGPAGGKVRGVATQAGSLFVLLGGGSREVLWRWSDKDGWIEQGTLPGSIVPGTLRGIGQAHLLFAVRMSDGAVQAATFHLITRAFALQSARFNGSVTRGTAWRQGLLLETRDAASGAPAFATCEFEGDRQLLRPLDWLALFAYLAGISAIGYWCYVREKKQSTASFFVGGRSIPFWAAGISLYASNSSSIGYIATTAKAYTTNWQYFLSNIVNVFALVFVAIFVVPLLRRLELMSVFSYLDQRFHRSVRMAASAMCILMHLGGRMSVILFLPSLAIATVTGLDVVWSILMMGVVTIAYTALGGMKAVIWTDVAQVVVKFGGLFFALAFIIWRLRGGAGEFAAVAAADEKTKMFDWSFDLTKATVWGFIFLQLMETVLTFPKDQVLMQRVFATKSDREAGRSVWTFAALVLPGSLILYLIGTGLYVYYHSFPERMNPLLPNDATLPLFIAAELPAGVTGLVLAGLFSAAMGTLSSILNSVSTLVSVDFYERLAAKPNPQTSIRIAEWVTVLAGLIGIGLAILLSRFNINSFLDVALELAGLFGGAFGGAYTLGMFTRRANWQGVLIGMGFSFVATCAIWLGHLIHPFLYLAVSILFSIVVGYAASLFFPPPPVQSLRGLTILRETSDASVAT